MITDTKLDESFPAKQFMLNTFSTLFLFDQNDKGSYPIP